MKKYPYSFRLTEIAQQLIDHLSDRLGISKTGVVETSIRELARREGLYHASSESAQDSTKNKSKD